jgi:hypothetical protein
VIVDTATVSAAQTGLGAALFAVIFVLGGRIHPLRAWLPDRRTTISFSAGMSAAYVFVRLVPELHGAREDFSGSVSIPLPYEGNGVFFVALLGFLVFYGLDRLRASVDVPGGTEGAGPAFRLHVGGFAAYVGLVGYLLVRNVEHTVLGTALYVVAMAFHFLTVDHALAEEHGDAYQRLGRWMLAGAVLLGWGAGLVFALPTHATALLIAFISGAVILNSCIAELPSEKDGRFLPFMCGGLLYGVILLPLG